MPGDVKVLSPSTKQKAKEYLRETNKSQVSGVLSCRKPLFFFFYLFVCGMYVGAHMHGAYEVGGVYVYICVGVGFLFPPLYGS